jgi:hypothetical protein
MSESAGSSILSGSQEDLDESEQIASGEPSILKESNAPLISTAGQQPTESGTDPGFLNIMWLKATGITIIVLAILLIIVLNRKIRRQ